MMKEVPKKDIAKRLKTVFNSILKSLHYPEEWKASETIMISKDGNSQKLPTN